MKKYWGQRGGVKALLCTVHTVYMPAYESMLRTVLKECFKAAVHWITGCYLTSTCASCAADPLWLLAEASWKKSTDTSKSLFSSVSNLRPVISTQCHTNR